MIQRIVMGYKNRFCLADIADHQIHTLRSFFLSHRAAYRIPQRLEILADLIAEKILFLSQDDGIKKNNDKSLHSMLTVSDAKNVINSGRLNSEIAIKLNCAIHAVENGVPRAHILDGSVKHSVLLELFTVYGVGTAIVSDNKELYNHEKEYRK